MADVSRKPSLAVRIFGWVFIIVLVIAFGEFTAFGYYFAKDGRVLSAHARLLDKTNKFTAEILDPSKCAYIDTLYPHPYLAFVHKRHGSCSIPGMTREINSTGLFGLDYPMQHDPSKFTILLTGGSVAAQFGQIVKGGPLYLQDELNRCYRAPHGEKFEVLNGADGAWKQPQQAILYLIYGDYVDAVITLDGFNEYPFFLGGLRLEFPANNFVVVNPLVTNGYAPLAAAWLAKNLITYVANNPVLNKSYVVYMIAQHLHAWLEDAAKPENSEYKENFTDIFNLPSGWTNEQQYQYNIEQYRKYIRAMAAIAAVHHAKSAFFIQPVPAIGKVLTDEEKKVVGSLTYAALYRRITDDILELSKEKISVYSLLDILDGEKETLYADTIHFGSRTRGNQILAKVIAQHLSEAWGLERTCPAS